MDFLNDPYFINSKQVISFINMRDKLSSPYLYKHIFLLRFLLHGVKFDLFFKKTLFIHLHICICFAAICFSTQQTFVLVKTYWRRLQDVFSVTFFCLPRRLEDIIARRLANTSWRRFRKTYCKYVLKTSWRRLQEVLEDEKCCAEDVFKTSWRLLGKQEMFAG